MQDDMGKFRIVIPMDSKGGSDEPEYDITMHPQN